MADIEDDAVLKGAVRQVLLGANLKEMTLRKVMVTLATYFDRDVDSIAHRKRAVRACITDYLEHMEAGDNDHGDDDDDDDDEMREEELEEEQQHREIVQEPTQGLLVGIDHEKSNSNRKKKIRARGNGDQHRNGEDATETVSPVDKEEDDDEDDDVNNNGSEQSESLDDHNVSDDEPASGKRRKGSRAATTTAARPPAAVRLGLHKAVVLSPPLAELLGARVMSRQRVQQWVITYVKEHNLQDERDRRWIVADEALGAVFKVPRFTFFGLSRLIAENVSRADDVEDDGLRAEAVACDAALLAELRAKREEDIANGAVAVPAAARASSSTKKRKKKSSSSAGTGGKSPGDSVADSGGKPIRLTGLNKAVVLSPPLAELLGARVMSRHLVRKQLIAYVKERDLQDRADRRWIVSDETLRRVFKVGRFTFFSLSRMIADRVRPAEEASDDETRETAEACDAQLIAELEAQRAAEAAGASGGVPVSPQAGAVRSTKKTRRAAAPPRAAGAAGTRSTAL